MYKARSEELQNDVNKSTTLKEKLYLNNEKSGETTTLLKVADMDHNSEEYFQYKTSSIGGLSNQKSGEATTLAKVADMDHNSEEYFQYKTSSIGGLSNMKKSMTTEEKLNINYEESTEEAHGAVPDILISTDVSSFNVKDANSKTFVFEELPMDTVPDDPVPTDISSGAGKESKEGGRMNNRNGKNGKNNMNNRNGRNGGNNLRKSRNGNAKIHNKVEGAEEALKLEKMFANIQKEAHEFEEKYEDLLFAGIGGP